MYWNIFILFESLLNEPIILLLVISRLQTFMQIHILIQQKLNF